MAAPSIPFHTVSGLDSRIPDSDSRPGSRTGSRLFEVNIWIPFPREFLVEEAVAMRKRRE
jgi:hypothetical protein